MDSPLVICYVWTWDFSSSFLGVMYKWCKSLNRPCPVYVGPCARGEGEEERQEREKAKMGSFFGPFLFFHQDGKGSRCICQKYKLYTDGLKPLWQGSMNSMFSWWTIFTMDGMQQGMNACIKCELDKLLVTDPNWHKLLTVPRHLTSVSLCRTLLLCSAEI